MARPTITLDKVDKFLKNPKPLFKVVGIQMVSTIQEHIKKEEFDGREYPARYPGQDPPKVNIAGLVTDFKTGSKEPKARRFKDRPVLRDSGELLKSIAFEVIGTNEVQAGSEKQYAGVQQTGGITKIRLSRATRRRMGMWLRKKKNQKYRDKIKPLLSMKVLRTNVNARPYAVLSDKEVRLLVDQIQEIVSEEY